MSEWKIEETRVDDSKGPRTELVGTILADGYTIQIDVIGGQGYERRLAMGRRILEEKLQARVDERFSCTDCGADGYGFHACEGVPGGFGDEEEARKP